MIQIKFLGDMDKSNQGQEKSIFFLDISGLEIFLWIQQFKQAIEKKWNSNKQTRQIFTRQWLYMRVDFTIEIMGRFNLLWSSKLMVKP